MKNRKRLIGVLLVIVALVIMQLPVTEADAATSSASDFKMEGSTLVKYRGTEKNVSVPDTVEVIAEGAFEGNDSIELVVLPNSVRRIEAYAFWGCDNLDTVVLGKGLTQVGDYVFAGCKGLKQMNLPSNITAIGIMAFGDCVNLKDISIPKETTRIHETAFDGCYQLTIHCDVGSAADIFARAFYEKQQEMPEYQDVPNYDPSVTPNPSEDDTSATATPEPTSPPEPTFDPAPPDTSNGQELGSTRIVGNQAVVFISGATLDVYDASALVPAQTPAADFSTEMPKQGIPKFTIVDGKVVADQAFYRNTTLKTMALPDGIQEIGQFSFARSALTEISLPQGVETISYGAFYHCDDLHNVELPETVMLVEPKAFGHTGWVEDFLNGNAGKGDFLISGGVLVAYRGSGAVVMVPDGVRVIAAEAFLGHSEITSVTMPESLRVIGEGAFEDCTSLRKIGLNKGLEQIKDRAFLNCAADLIRVPSSVNQVGLRAFENIDVDYAIPLPENVYEVSATRLSNEANRAPEPDPEAVAVGVIVEEPEGASAVLEGAARNYVMQVLRSQEISAMTKAFQRAFGSLLPDGTYVYDTKLTDSSGIPIAKLGRQVLTVVLPLPDSLKGQELRLFGLDRNGQLEELAVELVTVGGQEAVRYRTNFISQICLCPTGSVAVGEPVEISVEMGSLSAPPADIPVSVIYVKYLIGGAVLLTGVCLILAGRSARRRRDSAI